MASVFPFPCIHGSCGKEEIRKSKQQSSQLLLHPLIQMTHSAHVTQQRCAPSEPAGPAAVPGAETSLSQEESQRGRGLSRNLPAVHPSTPVLPFPFSSRSLFYLPSFSIHLFISSFPLSSSSSNHRFPEWEDDSRVTKSSLSHQPFTNRVMLIKLDHLSELQVHT